MFTVSAIDALGFVGHQAYTVAMVASPAGAIDDIAAANGAAPLNIAVTANDTGVFTSIALVPSLAPGNGTAVVSGFNVIYTANAGFSGTDSFQYMLTGPGGSSSAMVTITVNPQPVAASRTADTMVSLPVVIDLTQGATGGPFTTAMLLSLTPATSGTASIAQIGSGANARFALTYAPAPGFSGVATVRFTLSNALATSQPATIAFHVVPRPDPSQNAEVSGLSSAQVESARRFAGAQTDNFQQRLERMHGAGEKSGFDNGLSVSYSPYCPEMVGALPGRRCEHRAGEVGGGAVPRADGKDRNAAFGVWASGMIRSGNHDGRNRDPSIDFETEGVSVGADYRLNKAFAFGGGLGYGRDESDIGDNGSRSESDAISLALYASYSPGERWFVDALLGYQSLGFDLRRSVAANDNIVVASRDGRQWFGSLSTGADIQKGEWQFTPYARLDVAQAILDGYTESGDPLYALTYDDMEVETTTVNAGLRIDYRREVSWGLWSPQFRVEYQHDFKGNGAQTLRYADLPTGPFYRADLNDFDRSRLMLGPGHAVQLRQRLVVQTRLPWPDWQRRRYRPRRPVQRGQEVLIGSPGNDAKQKRRC